MKGKANVRGEDESKTWRPRGFNHTWRLRPDTGQDRRQYGATAAGDFAAWRSRSLVDVEHAGQQEVLKRWALMGAMQSLGARLERSEFVETHFFNSNKGFAIYETR